MRLSHARPAARRGFTLVELMVVLAIISVLISLISAAVWKAITTANRTRNRSEISQLSAALENFKSRYGFYLPSKIRLAERLSAYNQNSQLDVDSVQTLMRMFPKMGDAWSSPTGINWGGRKSGDPPVDAILEGDQCLVFFLGGIPDNFSGADGVVTGFSTNPANPAAHIPTGDTLPSFFEFTSARLKRIPGGPTRSVKFYSYLDTYGTAPYAYFSSGKSRDNYNRYCQPNQPATWVSDCPTLRVWPYAELIAADYSAAVPRPRYINPNSFQIVSAGADGQFGSGTMITGINANGLWKGGPAFPANNTVYQSGSPGWDDQANFRESTLGVTD